MYSLKIYKKAKEILDELKKSNNQDLPYLIKALDEISDKWLDSSNIKNIWDWVYRKRVWRWRILFNLSYNVFNIWIIDIEKDTQKDYQNWKKYIISSLRNLEK